MNIAQLARDIGLAEDEYREILDLFVQTAMVDLASIKAAVAARDAGRVIRATHSLRGASANIGLIEISAEAQKVEDLGRAQRLDEATEAVQALERLLAEVVLFLAKEAGRAIADNLSRHGEVPPVLEPTAEKDRTE